jgi:hypothetical protein
VEVSPPAQFPVPEAVAPVAVPPVPSPAKVQGDTENPVEALAVWLLVAVELPENVVLEV